jgi:hypothetical protein
MAVDEAQPQTGRTGRARRTPRPECRRGNGARGSPSEIRRRQWEALARGIISQGKAHEAWR